MTAQVVIVGAGPAGTRAAERLLAAGLTPTILDEQIHSGGQVYRRPPYGVDREYADLYDTEHHKARALHRTFDDLGKQCRYLPSTTVWGIRNDELFVERDGAAGRIRFDRLILATGAAERVIPVSGWTLPGCFSLGGAQIALKAHGCVVGARTAFVGTGPLLYLVALQYARAGADVAGVFDTSPLLSRVLAVGDMLAVPSALWRGVRMTLALLIRYRVPIHTGISPSRILGRDAVEGFSCTDYKDRPLSVDCSAVALGYDLRCEAQLADIIGCDFAYDDSSRNWYASCDPLGRTSIANVYLAGDGSSIRGADAAEIAGELTASAVCEDLGHAVDRQRIHSLLARVEGLRRFRRGLEQSFPPPLRLIPNLTDDVLLCRCEGVTVGAFRNTVRETQAKDINRAKSMTRCGMGRCQGRYCEFSASELLASICAIDRRSVGRLRAQPPAKPMSTESEQEVGIE